MALAQAGRAMGGARHAFSPAIFGSASSNANGIGCSESCPDAKVDLAQALQSMPGYYRFENWKRFRAPGCPDFFRSFIRGSRRSVPSVFNVLRTLPST